MASSCSPPSHATDRHERAAYARLLDLEPDFAAGVRADVRDDAHRRAIVPLVEIRAGACDPCELRGERPTGAFAALVVSGLLVREVELTERVATQLVGPGDVLALTPAESALPTMTVHWRAASDVMVALLDDRFLGAAQRWPWLTARLVERTARWSDRGATLQAIGALGTVDLRILAMLWHLAERWGHVTLDGVVVPVSLTHETLGRLVGAQRPTVTIALKMLRERNALQPRGRAWLLHPASLDLFAVSSDPWQPAAVALVADRDGAPAAAETLAEHTRRTREDGLAIRARSASAREQARAQREDSVMRRAELIRRRRARDAVALDEAIAPAERPA